MNAEQIRTAYLKFFNDREHATISRAQLVPQNDPLHFLPAAACSHLLAIYLEKTIPRDKNWLILNLVFGLRI